MPVSDLLPTVNQTECALRPLGQRLPAKVPHGRWTTAAQRRPDHPVVHAQPARRPARARPCDCSTSRRTTPGARRHILPAPSRDAAARVRGDVP